MPRRACGRELSVLAGVLVAMIVAMLVGACQPLPHPFADDRPPAALLRVRDVAGVSVAPIAGKPQAAAKKLAAAVAKALLKHDIPASERTASLDSYQLYGQLLEEPAGQVTAKWRLIDAKGRLVGERTAKIEAASADWAAAADPPIERLAGLTADAIAPLLEDEAPKAVAQADQGGRTRVALGKVEGAPGDGDESLANAVAAVLKRQDLAIVTGAQKPDLYVDAAVAVTPDKTGQQHVKIVWRVRRADGAQIGTVGQENDVPKGLLDGPWGDVAYNIALAAGDGLMQLVARGAPPPGKS
ncbi:MAG TPA: hypothetical protein VKQ73_12130 [Stellaceae bacterium]|nr:hypothetical protein [Stellaceae bacterium]